jgi:hypothetical protein
MQAKNGVHYNLSIRDGKIIGMQFTQEGIRVLSHWQRGRIEAALFAHELGESFDFPDYTEVYEYEPETDNPEVEEIRDCGDYDASQDEALADRIYEESKDCRFTGFYDYRRDRR